MIILYVIVQVNRQRAITFPSSIELALVTLLQYRIEHLMQKNDTFEPSIYDFKLV